MYDDYARECFSKNKNSVISWVLMASYSYYCLDTPLLSDEVFDKMMSWIGDNYDNLEHRHKHLISKEDCIAGSLYSIGVMGYPNIVKNSAEGLLNKS